MVDKRELAIATTQTQNPILSGLTQYRYIWCKNYNFQDIATIDSALA